MIEFLEKKITAKHQGRFKLCFPPKKKQKLQNFTNFAKILYRPTLIICKIALLWYTMKFCPESMYLSSPLLGMLRYRNLKEILQ